MTDERADHTKQLADLIQTQNHALKFYERRVKYLENKVREQAEMIVWLSNKHEGFYQTEAWLELRIRVLDTYGSRCMCCGNYPPDVVIHVDHIKPISIFPELALEFDNCQVLCENCNRGKSNKIMTDFRPKKKKPMKQSVDFQELAKAARGKSP